MMATMSYEAMQIIPRIVKELNGCSHLYRDIVYGAYDACIENYGMAKPIESREEIADSVIEVFKQAYNINNK